MQHTQSKQRAAYTRASVASEQLTHSIEGARDHVKLAHGNEQEDIEPHLLASMLRGAAGCSRFSPVALDDLSTPMLGVAVAAFIGRTCCGNILAMHVMASLCGEGRDRWLARVELRAASNAVLRVAKEDWACWLNEVFGGLLVHLADGVEAGGGIGGRCESQGEIMGPIPG